MSSSFSFRPLGGFPPFRDPSRKALSLCEPLISMIMFRCGL